MLSTSHTYGITEKLTACKEKFCFCFWQVYYSHNTEGGTAPGVAAEAA